MLISNEKSSSGAWGLALRRWPRPSARDVVRRRTWSAASELVAPVAGTVDERPVVAADRTGGLVACWARTADVGAYARQAVLCRRSPDGGVSWGAPAQLSPSAVAGVPYGPYVAGVAVMHRRGVYAAAWVDALAGVLDGTGLDAAWISAAPTASAGARRSAPSASGRSPDRFAADSFRNVTLLALAAWGTVSTSPSPPPAPAAMRTCGSPSPTTRARTGVNR